MTINASIYVGTYAKYNSGSIKGAWLKLADYPSQEELGEAMAKIHADEHDPEYMIQDWEGFPEGMCSEYGIADEFWELLEAMEQAPHLDADVWVAGAELGIDPADIPDMYQGHWNSDREFAMDLAEDIGALDENLSWPHSCIDWDRAARELMFDFQEHEGHYFSR